MKKLAFMVSVVISPIAFATTPCTADTNIVHIAGMGIPVRFPEIGLDSSRQEWIRQDAGRYFKQVDQLLPADQDGTNLVAVRSAAMVARNPEFENGLRFEVGPAGTNLVVSDSLASRYGLLDNWSIRTNLLSKTDTLVLTLRNGPTSLSTAERRQLFRRYANGLFRVPSAEEASDEEVVAALSDIEDFFPVWFDIAEALDILRAVKPSARIGVRLRCDDAEIGVVPTSLARDHAGDYLRNVSTAESLASATSFRVGSLDAGLFPTVLSQMSQNPNKGVFLLEGATQGRNAALHVDLLADGEPVLRATLPLSISPVEDFYRWVNLRAVAGGSESRWTDISQPSNFPDAESNGKNVVFIHGFSVTENGARGWNAELFKRLWQCGCQARFYAVTWYGNDGMLGNLFDGGDNYHGNVVHAFETASEFATSFGGSASDTTILAHSLGNMVASSAIQDWNLSVDDYFMLNAAVPAESYDESQWNTNAVSNHMLHPEWESYAPRTWSAVWFTNFHDPDDSRSSLFWKGRFKDVFSRTTLYNFHSGTAGTSGDQVLEVSANRPDMTDALHYSFPWTVETGHLAWQKQELGKGRLSFFNWHFAGTTWAGWGHATKLVWHDLPSGNGGGYASEDITAAEANAMTESQIQSTPAFRRNPDKMLSSSISYSDQCEILACGIPALSGPAGTRVLGFTQDQTINASRNIDMTTFKDDSTWPVNAFFGTRWLHSDFKAVALPNVFGLFNEYCTKGNLK